MDTSSPPDIPVLDYEPIEPGNDRGSGKRRGLYGCLLFFVIVAALIGGSAYYAYKRALDVILEDTPPAWPSIRLSKAEIDLAEEKADKIIKTHEEGGPPVSFAFSDRELNALFARSDKFRNRVFLTVVEDEIKVEFSVPYRERFLNGLFQGNIEADQGAFHLSLRSAQVGNYIFPEKMLQHTSKFLEEEINKSPEVKESLRTIHTVKIANGLIFLELRPEQRKD